MKKKIIYISLLCLTFNPSFLIFCSNPFGSNQTEASSPFGNNNANPFGTNTINLANAGSTTAQNIAGSTSKKPGALSLITQAQSLNLQNIDAINILKSRESNKTQKAVVMLATHTNPQTTAKELSTNIATAGAQQVTFSNKKDVPPALRYTAEKSSLSFTQIHQKPNPFKPSAGITSNTELNALYNTFLDAIENTPGFIPMFRKLHIVALHQIYNYLMGIYAGLNITHIDNLENYITLEALYGLNKKTLLINHLINLIESQLNQAIRSLFPNMPEGTASHTGMTAINLDNASKLDLLIIDMEEVVLNTFNKNIISPADWKSVLESLTDKTYQTFLQKVNQTTLQNIIKKMSYYLNTSMNLSAVASNNSTIENYQTTVSQTYKQAPQSTLFGDNVPSGLDWQQKVDSLVQKTNNIEDLPHSVSLIKQLEKDEITILVDALDIITTHCASLQEMSDIQNLIAKLNNNNTPLTEGEFLILLKTIRPLALDGPLNNYINMIKQLQPLLVEGSKKIIDNKNATLLQDVLGFVCTLFEGSTGSAITTTLTQLKVLVKKNLAQLTPKEKTLYQKYNGFTATEQAILKTLATKILTKSSIINLISAEQRQTLSNGFTVLAAQDKDFPAATCSLFSEIANTIKNAKNITFSQAQQTAFLVGLNHFKTFTVQSYSLTQAENDMYSLFDKKRVDTVTENFSSAKNKSSFLENLSAQDQLIMLVAFQVSALVLETRNNQHQESAQNFLMLIGPEKELKQDLYHQINYQMYANYVTLYQDLTTALTNKTSFLPGSLPLKLREDLYNIIALLVAPEDNFNDTKLQLVSKKNLGILELINQSYIQNATTKNLLSFATTANQPILNSLYKKIRSYTFSVASLTSQEKNLILKIVNDYQTLLKKNPSPASIKTPSSQTKTGGLAAQPHPLSQSNQMQIEAVMNVLHAFKHLSQMQNDFTTTLGSYLNFFTPYTATLQEGFGSVTAPSKNNYQGLTQFSNYAQSIAQNLPAADKINSDNSINPPLFFYNQQTLDLINILPALAESIQGTMSAPLPTQAIDAALSTNPSGSKQNENNLIITPDGTTITVPSLTITTNGSTYSPKFFFKDRFGKPFANISNANFKSPTGSNQLQRSSNTNPELAWLQKCTLKNTTNTTDYFYLPTINADGLPLKPEGEQGLYMNIPMAHESPLSQGAATIRLYEQKIIPQPEWLNSKDGVITMVRTCLGDFASGLTLESDIFDPCLELIFRKALETLPTLPAQLPNNKPFTISAAQLKKLSQSCHLSLVRNYINAQKETTAKQEIANTQTKQGNA